MTSTRKCCSLALCKSEIHASLPSVFSLDPRYAPGSSAFIPMYDAVHYNFTSMTWATKLYSNPIRNGSFELLPILRIPELDVIADVGNFAFSETYEPFLKVYSTTEDEKILEKKQAWNYNTDVLMRTVKYSRGDTLQVCARGLGDAMEGLGEMTPVPVGLLILLRVRRMPLKSPSDGLL
jgi:hypothetical protein